MPRAHGAHAAYPSGWRHEVRVTFGDTSNGRLGE
jgi:hypothetical protein